MVETTLRSQSHLCKEGWCSRDRCWGTLAQSATGDISDGSKQCSHAQEERGDESRQGFGGSFQGI